MAKTEPTKPRKPRISVLERRLQNPFGEPSVEIRMKDPNVKPRWFNDDARPGQIHRAKELGWVPVDPDMVEDPDSIGFHTVTAGQIVRGPRGQEVLMWMPLNEFNQIQLAKTEANYRAMRDFDRQKSDMLEAAAAKYGSEAADFLNDRVTAGSQVKDYHERIERLPETE